MKSILFYGLMLMCMGQLFAQTTNITLTQKQVMNFEVGDVFHYNYGASSGSNPPSSMYRLYERTILGKTYNQDSSTVTYQVEEKGYQKTDFNANWAYQGKDTINLVYHLLNDLCSNYFNVLIDSTYPCNGNTPLANFSSLTQQPDSSWGGLESVVASDSIYNQIKAIEGLGVVDYYISGFVCSRSEELLWCKKGNQTFGTPSPILSDSNIMLPNVLKRKEVFNFEVGDVFQVDSTYTKWSMAGEIDEKHLSEYTILAKDTINNGWLYTIEKKDSMYRAKPYPPAITYTQNTITLFYDNLDDWVSDPQHTVMTLDSTCFQAKKAVHQYYGASINYSFKDEFYEGMGKYVNNHEGQLPSESVVTKLLYAYKAKTNQSCGTYTNIKPVLLLKRNEVFNFDLGDVLQFDSVALKVDASIEEAKTHHIEYTILSKNTVNGAWVYSIARKDSMIHQAPTWNQIADKTYSEGTITLTFDRLEEVANPNAYIELPNDLSSCWAVRKNVYETNPVDGNKEQYYEGLGAYINTFKQIVGGYESLTQNLKYFYKASTNQSCGTAYVYSVDTTDTTHLPPVTLVSVAYNNQTLSVINPRSISAKTLSIFNTQGLLVYQVQYDANQTQMTVPVELFANTLYFIALDFDETHLRQKMMLLE